MKGFLKAWFFGFLGVEAVVLLIYLSVCFVAWEIVSVDIQLLRLQMVIALVSTCVPSVIFINED